MHAPDSEPSNGEPWAVATLQRSFRRAGLVALACSQVALIGVALMTHPVFVPAVTVVIVHVLVALLAVGAGFGNLSPQLAFSAGYGALLLDYYAAPALQSPLGTLAVWGIGLTLATPALVLAPRGALLFGSISASWVAVVMVLLRPEWAREVQPVTGILGFLLMVCVVAFMQHLRRYGTEMDRRFAALEQQRQQVAAARRAAQEAVEDARLVHDTVVNTLGAIATGDGGANDPELVRQRCAKDVTVLQARLHDLEHSGSDQTRADTGEADDLQWVRSADPAAVKRFDSAPPEVRRALNLAVAELLRNAMKHAEADEIGVELRASRDALLVEVVDDGVGFDGQLVPGRGLAESVVGRLAPLGIDVEIDTAPGDGTRVVLRWSSESTSAEADMTEEHGLDLRDMVRSGAWGWTRLIVAYGLIALLVQPGPPSANAAMIGIVGGSVALAWWSCRSGRELPLAITMILIAAVPAGLSLGVALALTSGMSMHQWQVAALTPLLVVLAGVPSSRWPAVAAITGLVLATIAIGLILQTDRPTLVLLVISSSVVQLSMVIGWLTFQESTDRISGRLEHERRLVSQEQVDRQAREVIRRRRQRWFDTSLRSSLSLLSRIAAGNADSADPTVQAECSREEHRLRQLTQISPELLWMAPPLGDALGLAHERGVRLTVRAGSADTPDEATAAAFGRFIKAVVTATRSGSDDVIISLAPSASGLQMRVVFPHGAVTTPGLEEFVPIGWTMHHLNAGRQDLIELLPDGSLTAIPPDASEAFDGLDRPEATHGSPDDEAALHTPSR